jgi:superfamily II DNA or RNA helicase
VYAITTDLTSLVGQVERGEMTLDTLIVIEEHPDYPGELVFQPTKDNQAIFYSRYQQWLSRYLVLGELYNLPAFIDQLCHDGYEPIFGPSCEPILAAMMWENRGGWMLPLKIEGYDLHKFQQYGLRRALGTDFWFWNWSTGSGKSFCSAAGAKELFDRGEIDVVIACTVSKSKIDLCRFFEHAGLDAVVNDGTKPKRTKVYAEGHQAYIMNYEKLWVDYDQILDLVHGLRVLFIFDECHKIVYSPLNNGTPNKARRAFHKLRKMCRPKVWPMSASVVNGNPLRFRDVFSLADPHCNPLGPTSQDFLNRYADEVKTIDIETKTGRTFPLTVVKWNPPKLTEVRHRVGAYTQAVRKTDPGVAPYFKGMQTIVELVQMSPEERQLADVIIDRAWDAHCDGKNLKPYYDLLRYAANIPEALRHTEHEEGKLIAAECAALINKINCSKLEMLNDLLVSIREQGDQALVFCHHTALGIHLIVPHLTVPYVKHFGLGQSDKESQRVKDEFKANPDITAFVSSDAGSHGISMQNSKYVINYDCPYSYDDLMQRNSRIDRADSHLDALTSYVFITEDSVEERVWAINNDRRILSGVVQGTEEVLSYGDRAMRSENENLSWLIFGDRF